MPVMKRHLQLLPWRLIPVDIDKHLKSRRHLDEERDCSAIRKQLNLNEKGSDMSSIDNKICSGKKDNRSPSGSQSAQKRLLSIQEKIKTEKHKDNWRDKYEHAVNRTSRQSPPTGHHQKVKKEEIKHIPEVRKSESKFKVRVESDVNKKCKAQSRLENLMKSKKSPSVEDRETLKKKKKQENAILESQSILRCLKNVRPSRKGESNVPIKKTESVNNNLSPEKNLRKNYVEAKDNKKQSSSLSRNLFKRKHVEDSSYQSIIKEKKRENGSSLGKVLGSGNSATEFESSSFIGFSPRKGTKMSLIPGCSTSKSNTEPRFEAQDNVIDSEEFMDWEPLTDQYLITELKTVRNNLDQYECNMDSFSNKMCVDINIAPSDAILYVVVDTNILISNIGLIKRLLSETIGDFKPIIVIPWQVLKELDYLKGSNSNQSKSKVSLHARQASAFLLSKMPDIRCQSQKDSLLNNVDFVVEIPDDNLIKCCLQIKSSGHNVVLLSNDRNLCLKCTATDLLSISENVMLDVMSVNKCPKSTILEIEREPEGDCRNLSLHNIAHQLGLATKEFLSSCIECGLKHRYQFLWMVFAKLKPWTLSYVLNCAQSQLSTITGIDNCKLHTDKLKSIKNFLNSVKYDKTLNESELERALQDCNELMLSLPSIFQPFIDEMRFKLNQINVAITERKKLIIISRIARAVTCFQLVEIVAKYYCNLEEKQVPENLPSLSEVISTLEAVIFLLSEMYTTQCKTTTIHTNWIREIHKCLVGFCGNINIECKQLELIDLVEFNNDTTIRMNLPEALRSFKGYLSRLKDMKQRASVLNNTT